MKREKITIRYVSDTRCIVDWIDKALKETAKKEGYKFSGSGFLLPKNERDITFEK